ncbi:helix-turn-helix domain-containing protein [Nocardia blacklockiae]|uniref:helix-turn-helix domain-containing protein n=1 Tax=Nocardia blacklockiae TaxID=480036 RepID=UPI001895DBC3|nr:helix-turn-helix domain-containing protein [Nocardia blacklockiae]MBF6172109.1 helix-turn-helix domain-containing protein [Nocardia blacklockiae]
MHMTTGEVIRRVRKSIGMTQAELAALIHLTQPAVSQLEHDGPAVHDVRTLRRVARALGVPLDILVVEDEEEADVKRREFFRAGALGAGSLAAVAASTSSPAAVPMSNIRVGAADVAALTDSVNQIHDLDLVIGGDRLRGVAAGQARYARHVLDVGDYSEAVGRELAGATAEILTAAGWVHYDSGRPDSAGRYYTEAAQTAAAADDGIAAAHAFGNASHLMVNRFGSNTAGDQMAVQYARAASRAARSHGGPKLRALMALREAEAHGARGERTETVNAISRAFRAYDSVRGFDPDWVYLPEAQMSGVSGKAHMRLGDHKAATAHFNDAISSSDAWPRERASWQLHLAHNLVRSGDIAQACALLTNAFTTISDLASARLQRRLDEIAAAARPYAKVSEAREFLGMWAARA